MQFRMSVLFISLLTALSLFMVQPALAKSVNNDHRQSKKSTKLISSQQAISIVKRQYGGKVLKVNRINVNGRTSYKVKLLKKNGHIVSVLVNAQTGRVQG
jgi:uncharacterized membrane protein YkoI